MLLRCHHNGGHVTHLRPAMYRRITLCVLIACPLSSALAQTATLKIDANKVENTLSPTLYGQFAEFMFEDIKGGLSAELTRPGFR